MRVPLLLAVLGALLQKNSENFNFKLIIQNTNVIGPSTIVIVKKFFNVKVLINRQ